MMIDWKKIPKIDAHIHLLPEDVIRANLGCGDPFVDFGSVSDYLAVMEEYNIVRSFLMPFNDPYMLSMDFTVESVHTNLQKMAHQAPDKLCCFADVDIRRPLHQTLAELEKVLARKDMIGIKLHPTNGGYPIDGAYYDGIFRFAEEHKVLVEIHSYPREHLTDDVCSPSRIKRVLARYPRLRLSIAHLGGFQFREFYGVKAWFSLSAVLPDLADRFGIQRTNEILREIGVEKLIFATDYPDSRCLKPKEIYDRYFEILGEMDFSREEAEDICRNNALRMLKGEYDQ